ncbi:c-type cytochrome [Pseudomonas sp.]|uniref:c-type cytochrome n=1 Tax=Pseudomonas sp. TaxID=306 RepID=UPI00272A8A98|nr:cytochrome c [Pseudomonas sp.]
MPAVSPRKSLVLLLAAALLGGCADQVDPNSPEGQRQAIFTKMLNQTEPMAGMLGERLEFDGEAFAAHAARLQELASQPWEHFPEPGDSPQRNAARPEVWSDPLGFSLRISDFETSAALLARAVGETVAGRELVREPFRAVQQACKACHDDFRR